MSILKKINKFFKNNNSAENSIYSNSESKRTMNSSCTLEFSAKTQKQKEALDYKVKTIVKKYIKTPSKLLQYIKMQGVNIYKINNAEAFLNKFCEEEGFIIPFNGYKAFLLNLYIGICCEKKLNLSFKTKPMIIVDKKNKDFSVYIRALYKFNAMKTNISGYDEFSQKTLKKVYAIKNKTVNPFATCNLKEIYACKEAMARDLESIKFAIELAVEYENTKKVLMKLKNTKSINV